MNMVQFYTTLGLLLSISAAFVSAAPAAAPEPTAAPDLAKRATCTFSDAASASKSKKTCATIVLNNIAVPSGTTLDLTGLNSGTHVIFEGTTTFGYEEWSGPLISVSGANIVVTGASGSVLDGDGSRWWDGKGSHSKRVKPKFFYAHSLTGTSSISNIKILNSPIHVFSINGASGLTMSGITIDDSAGDTLGGHNTDAFDIGSSSNVYITGVNVKNQDDCPAINSGTGITFTNGYCSGGHGLSIGSVGGRSDNIVKDITISSSTIADSENGVRIKTVFKATGSVSAVTYKDITLSNISKYGIVVEQDYEDGSPKGTPTNGVPITGLTLNNVHGTVQGSGTDIYILCALGACSGWSWSGVDVTGGTTSFNCENIPLGAFC